VIEALLGARPLPRRARRHAIADAVESTVSSVPRLRGVLHEKAFAFAPALGFLLVVSTDGARDTVAASVFVGTLTLMLGVSAFNHRIAVSAHWRPWLRRLDHTTVNLFLAGTWTSFALLVTSGARLVALTLVVCIGAILASLVTIMWVHVRGWIPATIGLAAGWSAASLLADLGAEAGPIALGVFLVGGVFYTAGAIVYGLGKPNPFPSLVGYHEIFHALVIAGAICHYLTLAFFVLPISS
jgi:hemolysin III